MKGFIMFGKRDRIGLARGLRNGQGNAIARAQRVRLRDGSGNGCEEGIADSHFNLCQGNGRKGKSGTGRGTGRRRACPKNG